MAIYLLICFLLTAMIGPSDHRPASERPNSISPAPLLKVGLVDDSAAALPDDARANDKPDDLKPDPSTSCAHVAFTRGLQYGETDLNVLDVATGEAQPASPRPVLLFVAGESFSGESAAPDIAGPLQDQA